MADFASIRFQPSRPLLRELTADRLNAILTEIKRNKPKGERGITVRQDGTSTYIGLASAPQRGGGTAATIHPFQISSRQDPNAPNQVIVTVRPGTINGILADDWGDEITIPKTSLRYIVLECEHDGRNIVSSSLEAATDAPSSPPVGKWSLGDSPFRVLLGLVFGTDVKQIVFANLTATGKKRLTTEKQTAELGEIPYDNWYSWEVA
jgi:hypothetical protein